MLALLTPQSSIIATGSTFWIVTALLARGARNAAARVEAVQALGS
jgi:hypothetical protein